jgi:hypothetical protein
MAPESRRVNSEPIGTRWEATGTTLEATGTYSEATGTCSEATGTRFSSIAKRQVMYLKTVMIFDHHFFRVREIFLAGSQASTHNL